MILIITPVTAVLNNMNKGDISNRVMGMVRDFNTVRNLLIMKGV